MSYNVTNCLEEKEYNYLSDFLSKNKQNVTMVEQRALLDIFNRVFNQRKQMSSCPSCIRGMIADLRKLMNNYE
jgi:hypothetical protein